MALVAVAAAGAAAPRTRTEWMVRTFTKERMLPGADVAAAVAAAAAALRLIAEPGARTTPGVP